MVSIIAGTSIGGGFLALPFATAPAGFAPSAVGLFASWLFLLSCGLAFAEATVARMDAARLESQAERLAFAEELAGGRSSGIAQGRIGEDDDGDEAVAALVRAAAAGKGDEVDGGDEVDDGEEVSDVSVFSVAQDAGGNVFGFFAGLLFTVRCLATLGAQDSKAG